MKTPKQPEEFGDDVLERWEKLKKTSRCCWRECVKVVSQAQVEDHITDVKFYRNLGHRAFRGWVRTIYLTLLPFVKDKNGSEKKRGNKVVMFSVPAIGLQLCQVAFCALMGVNKNALSDMVKMPPSTATPPSHGNRGRAPPNVHSVEKVEEAIHFFVHIAEREGVPNPRFSLDRTESDGPEDFLNIVHLPPSYTFNSLYHRYARAVSQPMCRSSLRHIFNNREELQHIKLSKRTQGMCEVCKSLRLSLQRASSNERATSIMNHMRIHLQRALDLRTLYKERIEEAITVERGARLPVAAISFDYATQLSLPISAMETRGVYFITVRFGCEFIRNSR